MQACNRPCNRLQQLAVGTPQLQLLGQNVGRPSKMLQRQRKQPQGIAHIASATKSGLPSHKGTTAGHALLHRRVDTSLYVRGVNGVSGQNTIVKNAGKEKADEQAITKEVPETAAAGAAAQLKDPVLLARYGLAQTSSCVAAVATQCTTSV